MKNLFFDWEINDHTGWGIYGLNLLIHGSANKNKPVALQWPPKLQYPLDPIAAIQLQQLIDGWINIKKIKNEDIVLGKSKEIILEQDLEHFKDPILPATWHSFRPYEKVADEILEK